MFTIYKRQLPDSVPSWDWFFGQLRRLGRKMIRVGEESIKDSSLDRDHFEAGFWLNVDGNREIANTIAGGSNIWNLHRNSFGGNGPNNHATEYVSVGVRKRRVTIDSKSRGSFMASYALRVSLYTASGTIGPPQQGVYATLHIDGRPIEAATDYTEFRSVMDWASHGDTPRQKAGRLCGFGLIELVEGVHTLEVVLHTHYSATLLRIEEAVAEIH